MKIKKLGKFIGKQQQQSLFPVC